MVADSTMRTYGVNQEYRFVGGIWLHRKSRQIRFFSEITYFPSYVRNMFWATILYKYYDVNRVVYIIQVYIMVLILDGNSKHVVPYAEK